MDRTNNKNCRQQQQTHKVVEKLPLTQWTFGNPMNSNNQDFDAKNIKF